MIYGIILLAIGCSPGGESGSLSSPMPSVPQLEQQAITNMLELYRQAVLQEDIDRLQALVQLESTATLSAATQTFLATRSEHFRAMNITALHIPAETVQVATDRRSMSFLEIESAIRPDTLVQHTQLFHTTVHIVAPETKGVVTIRMSRLQRSAAPLVQVITPGQVQAGALTRLEVIGSSAPFGVTEVQIVVPETAISETLTRNGEHFYGVFTPPDIAAPQPLRVHLRGANGETLTLDHPYRMRRRGEGVVQRFDETGGTLLTAVAVASDGTIWAGGNEEDGGATLYVVPPGSDTASVFNSWDARVEDLSVDALGRVHVLLLEQDGTRVSGQRVEVHDPSHPDPLFCRTMDVFGPAYPLRDLQGQRSASTRLTAAEDGDVWLFGSDGGVARVRDTFRSGLCLAEEETVRYEPIFRRAEGALPANIIPALTTTPDGALWFGSIFGVSRLFDGQWTAVPFHPALSLQGSVATLERFFQALAEAIFKTQPVVTVERDGVLFVVEFGRSVIKEDLSWSMEADNHGRVWVGTLGGGLRVMAAQRARVGDLWHLTRTEIVRVHPENGNRAVMAMEGLSSNIILALAAEKQPADGTMWAATDEGLSRIQEHNGMLSIKNFSSLDGVSLPVNDLAIDPQDRVWLATGRGLLRLLSEAEGGAVQGLVLDLLGNPVVGADVLVVGTPWRAVTDATGHFRIANMPPGPHHLQVDGALATGGPFGRIVQPVMVHPGQETLTPPLPLARCGGRQLVHVAGDQQSEVVDTVLPQPLVVALLDASGHGIANVPLTFAADNGSITPARPVPTNDAGQAAVTLTLGTASGANVVTVTMPEETGKQCLSLALSATGLPDRSSARLVSLEGNSQSAQVRESLPLPLVVRLEDQFRNPLAGIEITASIQQGVGVISALTSPQSPSNDSGGMMIRTETDGDGKARFQLQVGADQQDILVEVALTAPEPDLQHVLPVRFLTIVGMVDIAGLPWDLAVNGHVAYVASGTAGLQIVDLSDIQKPQVKTTITTLKVNDTTTYSPSFLNVAMSGTSAYVATFTPTTFTRLDMANPLQPVNAPPVLLKDYQSSRPVKIVLDGNRAYLALANRPSGGSLHIFDISDPSAPKLQGSTKLSGAARGLTVVEQLAYIPVADSGIVVVDVHDSRLPQVVVDSFPLHSISSAGKTAYTIERRQNEAHLRIFDLSTPGHPTPRGSIPIHARAVPFTAASIAISGPFAYVASFDRGLQVFDIRDPDDPQWVAMVDTHSVAFNVMTTSDTARTRIYVTDLAVGLNIVLGPPHHDQDTDGDGVGNFFDEFPLDAAETMDTDRDGQGNHVDLDDDNDGVLDAVEEDPRLDPIYPAGLAPTDPLNPKDFPVSCRIPDDNTLVVDATASTQHGDGSPHAPYRSIGIALRAASCLRAESLKGRLTVSVRPGIYSALHTMESFPLRLTDDEVDVIGAGHSGTPGAPLSSCDAIPPPQTDNVTIVDAAFFADVLDIVVDGPKVEGLVLQHGINGIAVEARKLKPPHLALQHLRVAENLNTGVSVVGGVPVSIAGNYVVGNGFRGLNITGTTATVTGNTVHCNGEDGVFLGLFAAADHIDNNLIANNAQDGIQIDDASTVESMSGNDIRANKARGLFVSDFSKVATVADNVIADNVDAGVRVSFLSKVTLIANLVRRNLDGIYVRTEATAIIQEGQITRNVRDGIFIADTAGKVAIACSGSPLSISFNQKHGIEIAAESPVITGGSPEVTVNRGNILFKDNGDADIMGNVKVCP